MKFADVLVDGRFLAAHKDLSLRFRGSGNQRIINIPASLKAGRVIPWTDNEEKGLAV
jgi:anaerobic ribonucleoside-triphosphate reductase activating protein